MIYGWLHVLDLLREAVVAFDAVQLAAKHVAKEWRGAQYVIQRGVGGQRFPVCLPKEDGDNGCREDTERCSLGSWIKSLLTFMAFTRPSKA